MNYIFASTNQHCESRSKQKPQRVQLASPVMQSLQRKYCNSEFYFSNQLIDRILKSKNFITSENKKSKQLIRINDMLFDVEDQNMEKYYKSCLIEKELPDLLEYYKYYSQHPICFLKSEFQIMIDYQEKKKANLYHKLKKVLELSGQNQSLESFVNTKLPIKNILSFLNFTKKSLLQNKDESQCFKQIILKLNNIFGASKTKTLDKIDRKYNFFNHKISFHKPKIQTQCLKHSTPKTILESTNISTKNGGMKKQYKNEKCHRRYGSTEEFWIDKKQKPKNGKSMDNFDIEGKETTKLKKNRKDGKRVQFKEIEMKNTQQFRLNIEELKKKINKQKRLISQTLTPKCSKHLKSKKK